MNKIGTDFISFKSLNELIEQHRKETQPYKNYEFDSTSYTLLLVDINNLLKENKQLKDNWNKLKEWLEKELGDRINPNKDKWLTGVYDAYRETIDKMQELEQGSDSNDSDR